MQHRLTLGPCPRRLAKIVGVFLCLLGSEGAWAQNLKDAAIGTIYSNFAAIGERQIPLPSGEWVLVARSKTLSGGSGMGVPMISVYLGQVEAGVAKRVIFASANLESSPGGWTRNRSICDRNDVFFNSSDKNYNSQDTECWVINHVGLTLAANASQVHRDFYRFTDDKGRPKTAVGISFYIVKSYNFFEVHYYANPEADGFEPTPTADWRGNPWHRDLSLSDPQRRAYLENLKAEGEKLFPLVKDGFRGRLTAPAVAKPAAPAAPIPSAGSSDQNAGDVAVRLQRLQDLLDRKLITPIEFDERRQVILKTL
jgi:hypothetical protein